MKLAIPKESLAGERRVAIIPDVGAKLATAGIEVAVQAGAGVAAHFPDAAYTAKGLTVAPDRSTLFSGAAVVAKVQPPTLEEVGALDQGTSTVSFLAPAANLDVIQALVVKEATAYSLELVPRISRAQSMDALSSQATVSGYLAGLAAAERLPKFFPMFMTAAGTVPPAKVLVLGAGVAGLQAIATARRL
ncbi:MAG TPA: NAD(P)(+) transhydrogenase (Re/Si-specific) subunit alpha, partial [Acidimicrobiales bacterium]|nr:NAD(P)(+) transhydrogenase (Re/Si-specific) subunit alpha [Acidimicrobiales bacterium]